MPLTRFERARIIGARALQVAMGAPTVLNDVKGIVDPMDIAVREFERGLVPLTVKRLANAVH
ncbi:MAG TPA: DNA-directed RNA polymerase subunit K [Thermoplasmata archaeon]